MSTRPKLLSIPLVRQAYEHTCGAASLAACLYYWGVWDGREPQLYNLIGTTEEGTSGQGIIQGAREYGLTAWAESGMTIGDLDRYVRDGYTVILSIQAWGNYGSGVDMEQVWEDGHYVVLCGVVDNDVYLMDPSVAGRYRKLSVGELLSCWHDYTDDGDLDWYSGIVLGGRMTDEVLRPQIII